MHLLAVLRLIRASWVALVLVEWRQDLAQQIVRAQQVVQQSFASGVISVLLPLFLPFCILRVLPGAPPLPRNLQSPA